MKKSKVVDLFKNSKVIPNDGVKYSELLKEFVNPFIRDFNIDEIMEDILDFAINAWNIGNLKSILPKDEFEKVMHPVEADDKDGLLLMKMVDHKFAKYKQFTNFIVDIELKKGKNINDAILSVITQESEPYMDNMLAELDEIHSENDFEENYINRNAIVVKPLGPFFDWYNKLNPDDIMDEVDEPNIYLIDDDKYDAEEWLKKRFDMLFMMELAEWHHNRKDWPKRRNFKMFKEWFQVEMSGMVYDLEKTPVHKFP